MDYYNKLSNYINKHKEELAKFDLQTFLTDTKLYIKNYAVYEYYKCPTFARTYINYDYNNDKFNLYNMLEGNRFDLISYKKANSLSEVIKLASDGKIDIDLSKLENLIKTQATLKGNTIHSISLSFDDEFVLRICDKKSLNIKATKTDDKLFNEEKDLAKFLTNVQSKIVKMANREQRLKQLEENNL